MDKTDLVSKVSTLFRISGHKVDTSVEINNREIDVRALKPRALLGRLS